MKNLKGKQLLDYIESNKRDSNIDGDMLCIGAGYATYAEDGTYSCDLQRFSSEVIKAKQMLHYDSDQSNARQLILDTYHENELRDIALEGCISGKAYAHTQLLDIENFFDEHSCEIIQVLENHFGDGYLESSKQRTGGEYSHWRHRAVWRFIEIIAREVLEKNNNQ
ncbi:hypothetical protein [Prochlorococcus sp. MIT 1300]|uniref:DUF7222 domain-containing protein n=1 Tax=Prochlorococcus sp. MIT 1300 TaxID=3096218 RepID=UPI002A756058|nr:hypothetical protein [Prochlorococcus sp. MIT 1300]